MANDVKPIPDSGYNLSSMNGILNTILSAFSVPEQPVTPLPPPLILFGAKLRPGLSSQSIAAEIISRQSESGRVVGDVFADGPNVEEAMELIRVQEIVKALLNEAKIEVVIPSGVQVLTVGIGNLGAPVISQGATTSIGIGDGVIR
jgi:urease gamma subunit